MPDVQVAGTENLSGKTSDEKLLTEIRDNFDYCVQEWREIREEAKTDMRYVSGDPWDPLEKEMRRQAHRPCIALDELNQYLNQLINDVRQNKRAIKILPKGAGATDKTAEWRQKVVRGIEYRSNAQVAYTTGFENAAARSYGYWRVNLQPVNPRSFDFEIAIRRIPNPDTVYFDPDYREYDASDATYCYVTDYMSKRRFKQKWPKARIVDFTGDEQALAPSWVKENQIQVAEYWKVTTEKKDWVELEGDEKAVGFLDSFPQQAVAGKIKRKTKVDVHKVMQYITNGIEILEEQEWMGSFIPIIPCFGKEIFVPSGSGSQRELMSLIRLARDPYMLYCYLCTQQCEEAGMSPKVPYMAYEGQFAGREDEVQASMQVPRAFLYAKAITDATGSQILPLPTRQPFTPNFQGYELAKQSARQAIQSAMGKYNTSVGKHDTNAQSGVAIQALDAQSDQGSFHFIDNYEHSLERTGEVIIDLMSKGAYGKEPRDVVGRNEDDTFSVIRINDPEHTGADGKRLHIVLDDGDHGVTVSTGPSFQSQREEAQNFVDLLVQNVQRIQGIVSPQVLIKILALSIRLKDLGPLGDEMADLLDPPQGANAPQQAQQALAAAQAMAQQLQAKVQELMAERAGKVLENQGRLQVEQLKSNTLIQQANIDREVKLAIAEIETKAQSATERQEFVNDLWNRLAEIKQQFHDQAHDVAMQAAALAHEKAMAQMAAQNAQQQSAQNAAQDQASQAAAPQQQNQPPGAQAA